MGSGRVLDRLDFDRILKDAEAGKVMQGVPHEFDPFDDLVEEPGDWTILDEWEDKAEAELTPEDNLPLAGKGPAI